MFKNIMIIDYVCINKESHLIACEEIKAISDIFKTSVEFIEISPFSLIIRAPISFAYLLSKRMSLLKKLVVVFENVEQLHKFLIDHGVMKIRVEGDKGSTRKILRELNDFTISLDDPDITIFSSKKMIGVILKKERKTFLNRNPPYRPYSPPYTMDSLLSRLSVNLSRAFPGCIFLDPFAGSGSFLIEAYFVGCIPFGIDISLDDLIGASYNLKFFNAKAFLIASDSTKKLFVENTVDSIATDPPYGRASRATTRIRKLYEEFLTVSYSILKTKRYLAFFHPNTLENIQHIVERVGFEHKVTFSMQAHKSLIRNLTVLRL